MPIMKSAYIGALLIGMVSAESFSADYRCQIRVVDSAEQAPIGKAHVIVHPETTATAPNTDQILDADRSGKVQLTLPSGVYDVCAMSGSFMPACQILDIRRHSKDLKFRLKPAFEILER